MSTACVSETCERCGGFVYRRRTPCKCPQLPPPKYSMPADCIVAGIGERVRACRKSKRLTMEALAKLAGCSKTMLWQIEVGQSEPGAAMLCKLSAALQVSMDFLARGHQ